MKSVGRSKQKNEKDSNGVFLENLIGTGQRENRMGECSEISEAGGESVQRTALALSRLPR